MSKTCAPTHILKHTHTHTHTGDLHMKHLWAFPAALSIAQPVRLVSSQVVLLLLPLYHTEDATDQSNEISPHVWLGMK